MIQLQQRRDLQKLLDHINHWPAAKERESEPQRVRQFTGNPVRCIPALFPFIKDYDTV